jgi:hypothetical protein
MLIYILIVLFVILISYQVYLAILPKNLVEGLENNDTAYKPYTIDQNNSLILSQQNAGNIEYIKQRLDSIQGLDQEVQDISGNVVTLQSQVTQLVASQKQYADKLTGGGTPPNVTGIGSTSSTDTSNLVSS